MGFRGYLSHDPGMASGLVLNNAWESQVGWAGYAADPCRLTLLSEWFVCTNRVQTKKQQQHEGYQFLNGEATRDNAIHPRALTA